jgi:Tfp pilus assembly protein PilZ
MPPCVDHHLRVQVEIMSFNSRDKSPVQEKMSPCQVIFFVDDREAGQGASVHFNERGMLVQCSKPVQLNKRIRLVLRFPGIEQSVELQAIVVWTNLHGAADSFTPRGMGVKFLSVDRAIERLLAKLSSQYDTIAGGAYRCYYS